MVTVAALDQRWLRREGSATGSKRLGPRQRRGRAEVDTERVVPSPDSRPVPGAVRRHHRLPLLFVPVTIGLAFLWPLCRASGTVRETHRCAI